MKEIKVFGHGPYIGTTGYANHTRDFFRELSKMPHVKFRNFTCRRIIGGITDEPHNDESYIT